MFYLEVFYMKMRDGLLKLRYNKKTGKWYLDKPTEKNPWSMTVYLLSDDLCVACGERFFYCSGNDGKCCSLSCNVRYRNSIIVMKESTKKAISKSLIGYKHTDKTKQNMKYRPQVLKVANGEWNPMWDPKTVEKRRKNVLENNLMPSGDKHPLWKNGRVSDGGYPNIFSHKLKRQIKERDGYICQNPLCYKNKHKDKLHIHHIDYNKHNNKKENLITLCNSCNVRANQKRNFHQKFYVWFQECRGII